MRPAPFQFLFVVLCLLFFAILASGCKTKYQMVDEKIQISMLKAPENAKFDIVNRTVFVSTFTKALEYYPIWNPDNSYAVVPIDVMKWAVAQYLSARSELGGQVEPYIKDKYGKDVSGFTVYRVVTNDSDEQARKMAAVTAWMIGIRYDIKNAGLPIFTIKIHQDTNWGGVVGDPLLPASNVRDIVAFLGKTSDGKVEIWVVEPYTGYMEPIEIYPNGIKKPE